MEYTTITLNGLTHEWIKQGNNRLMIIFPGMGYTCDKPLLYYSKKLALSKGFDVIALSYGDSYYDKSKMHEKIAELSVKLNGLDSYIKEYRHVIMVAKSIGCVLAGEIRERIDKYCRIIFITPIKDACTYFKTRDSVMLGDADPIVKGADRVYVDSYIVNSFVGWPKVYQRANHSLEVEDSVKTSMLYLKNVIETIERLMEEA